MPELPEVETVRRDLEAAFAGQRIIAVSAPGVHRLRRHTPAAELVPALTGRRVTAFDRRGKYLVVGLDDGAVLVGHLGMSGQLRATTDPATPRAPHTHVVIDWEDGSQLRLVDPRTFGELFVAVPVRGVIPELAHLGPDALRPRLPGRRVLARFAARRTRLKPLLMDQRFVAGIGNIYADEILWTARLHADRPADSLSAEEVARLWKARGAVLRRAVALRGSTLADTQYRDLLGAMGSYQHHHRAYGREGRPCRRCRTPIERVKAAGRSTFWCPTCQPTGPPVWAGGTVLAG